MRRHDRSESIWSAHPPSRRVSKAAAQGYEWSMSQDDLKRAVASAAMEYVRPGMVLGVGTGTTADFFIELLAASGMELKAVVPSSEATAAQLKAAGLPLADLPSAPAPSLYVDGADQVDPRLRLIKGRGGAQFREKLIATLSERFICIVDESKLAPRLGGVPVPLEVVAPAAAFVAARVAALGGSATQRRDFVTDNGNPVLDVTGLDLADPEGLEVELDALPGVVECGIFARRPADLVLCGGTNGVRVIEPAGR